MMAVLIGGAFWSLAFRDLDYVDTAIYLPVATGMIVMTWWFLPAVDVVFDRTSGVVVFEEARITGRLIRRYPLSEIQRTTLGHERHSTTPRLNRLFLETTGGRVALERGFGPYDRTALATAINRWIDPANPPDPAPR